MPTIRGHVETNFNEGLMFIKTEDVHAAAEDGRFRYFAANPVAQLNKQPRVDLNWAPPLTAAIQNGFLNGWQIASSAASGFAGASDTSYGGVKITTSAGSGDYTVMRWGMPWIVAADKICKMFIRLLCDDITLTNMMVGIGTQFGDPMALGTQQIVLTKTAGAGAKWDGSVRGTGANVQQAGLGAASANNTYQDLYIEFRKGSALSSYGLFEVRTVNSQTPVVTAFNANQLTQLGTITGAFQFVLGIKTGSAVARNVTVLEYKAEVDS